jgi:SulP family sulfate permease
MISSASAATAVVLAKISTDPAYGMGPMALCVFIVGVLQIIAGCLRLSRFITLIPHPVMLGFVNGLAIVMIKAQMRQFHHNGDGPWVDGDIIIGMVITALFSMLSAITWARIPYATKILPAPLASVIFTTVFSHLLTFALPGRTLGQVAGADTFSGGFRVLPSWDFPPVGVNYSPEVMMKVFAIAVRFAIVGLLESLMTEALIDQITATRSSMRRECFGQGVGNILASFFGTQGGCALIAQSLMNVGSGGRTRLSGVVMGITLALCVIVLAPLMALIPVAALVGLICLIALNTFAWGSLMLILRINFLDAAVVIIVTVVTVLEDLCVAVVYGVIISALGFAWHAATDVQVDEEHDDVTGERTFSLRGPLFFGSAMNYQQHVTRAKVPEQFVVLDFTHSRILDISAADAIGKARDYWEEQGKEVRLAGIPEDAMSDIHPSKKSMTAG